jgi:diadenosine tetraphosphate (Ap4A) HIT family hydrolase
MEEKSDGKCPFCTPVREVLMENDHALAVFDGYPVSRGHALVIPKRHVATIFDLDAEEYRGALDLLRELKPYLEKKHRTDAFNVGVNCGETAGQTVDHAHIHLIPRYPGDVANPRGGIRNIIPGKGDY